MDQNHYLRQRRRELISERASLIRSIADKQRPTHMIESEERRLVFLERKLADVEMQLTKDEN